jgi:hypothetical protein
MQTAQWCANPNIEVGMAKGNCIGCHQGAPSDFRSAVFLQQKDFGVSDFSFSFTTLADTIRKVDQEGRLHVLATPRPPVRPVATPQP